MSLPLRRVGTTGLALTSAGFGGAGIGGLYAECPEDRAMATLAAAWDGGIRHFDTAPLYGAGLSERRMGRFLQAKARDTFVLATKAGRLLSTVPADRAPFHGYHGGLPATVLFDYSGAGLMQSLQASLRRLRVDYVDILYLHDLCPKTHASDAFAAHWADLLTTGLSMLAELKAQGLIRAWGIAVRDVQACQDLLEQAEPDVIQLRGRFTLLDRSAMRLLPRMRDRGTVLVAADVTNAHILATGPTPDATFDDAPAPPDTVTRVQAMEAVCQRHGTRLLPAALQFALAEPLTASVILTSATPEDMQQNLSALREKVPRAVYRETTAFAL